MNFKKWAAFGLLAAMLFGLTGCVGNFYENAGTVNGVKVSSGLYLMAQYNAYTEAAGKDGIDKEKDLLKQKIDGTGASQWIKTRTEELLRRYVAVRTITRQKDIELDETGQQNLQQMEQYWTYLGPIYTENGISRETFNRFLTTDELSRQLFVAMFAEGGELFVPDADLKREYAEKFAHVRAFSVPLNTLDESADVSAEVFALLEKLPAKLKAGMSMEEMVEKELAAAYAITKREFEPKTSVDSIYSSYIAYQPLNFDTYSEEFLAKLKTQQVGDFGIYNMGSTALIYEIVPTFEDDEAFLAERESVLSSLKKDVYEEHLRSIYSQYDAQFLPFVRTYFAPSKIKET